MLTAKTVRRTSTINLPCCELKYVLALRSTDCTYDLSTKKVSLFHNYEGQIVPTILLPNILNNVWIANRMQTAEKSPSCHAALSISWLIAISYLPRDNLKVIQRS